MSARDDDRSRSSADRRTGFPYDTASPEVGDVDGVAGAAGGTGSGVRLQRVLAMAGVASRRASENLISAGRVTVNGHVVNRQGQRVDPDTDDIRIDGERVITRSGAVYLAVNKERGVVSTMADEAGRRSVGDYVADRLTPGQRVFHVGRLDADTEGLLLLTNDGEFANGLTHPSHGVIKTYLATVDGAVPRDVVRSVRSGIELDDGWLRVDDFRVLEVESGRSLVRVSVHDGRNRVVRRLFDAVGHPVRRLVRTHVGSLALGNLKPGRVRHLTSTEVSALYRSIDKSS